MSGIRRGGIRGGLLGVAVLASAACANGRGRAAHDATSPIVEMPSPDVGSDAVPNVPPPPPRVPRTAAPSGPTTADALAAETGLSVRDDGVTVSLVGEGMTARFFPNSPTLSISGRTVGMGENARRDGSTFRIPASGAAAVRQSLAAHRGTLMALKTPPPAPKMPVYRPSAASIARPKPKAKPTAAAAAAGDPDWIPTAADNSWRWIVVHHSDDECGSCARYDRIHRGKGWDSCGYHFVIGNGTESGDGQIEIGPRWPVQKHGAHAKTDDNRFNDYGIGIVLVGDFEHGGPPTPRQYAALLRLTRWLEARYGIGPADVIRHQDAKPTACPGRNFPWARFQSDLVRGTGGLAMQDDADEPACPADIGSRAAPAAPLLALTWGARTGRGLRGRRRGSRSRA